jgi:large subunit ribosomal protein L9
MKIILLEEIGKLGKTGDVVTVRDGYARNFLIPRNKAKEATPANMKMLDALKKKVALAEKARRDEAEALAGRIEKLSITISANAGEEDKLYGSVTGDDIAEALGAEGIVIDKKDITLDEPIKKLGVYQVTVKVHPEVRAGLKVWVVKK